LRRRKDKIMTTDIDSTLIKRKIDGEEWREYEWNEIRQNNMGILYSTGLRVIYHIDKPVFLYIRPGGTTHRIVDSNGIAHCVPAVGLCGCVIRWKNPDGQEPVNF